MTHPVIRGRGPVRAAFVLLPLLVAIAWPGNEAPRRFVDSTAYIQWPDYSVRGDVIESHRPAGYPLTLRVVGTGPALLHLQTWISFACFGLLGWLLAGPIGLAMAVFVAQADPIALWNGAVLAESLSLSGTALLASGALLVARARETTRPPLGPSLLLAGTAVALVLLRDANFLLLPVWAFAFRRFGMRSLGLALLFVALLAAASAVSSTRDNRWQIPYYTAVIKHSRSDPAALRTFRKAGMPGIYDVAALRRWLEDGGRREYEAFVLSRTASYTEAFRLLTVNADRTNFRRRYFKEQGEAGPVAAIGNDLWRMLGLPFWIWPILLGVPWVEWWRTGRVTTPGTIAALLVPASFGAAFASLHAAGTEEARHLLTASLLYRLGLVFAITALVACLLPSSKSDQEPDSTSVG